MSWRDRAIAVDSPSMPDTGGSWRDRAAALPNEAGQLASGPHSNVPQYLVDYLAPGGVPTDMLDIGATPGNAARWADLHIRQAERDFGSRLDPDKQMAIFDIYKSIAGRDDLSSRNFYGEQRERALRERRETLGGRFLDAGAAYNRSLGTTGTSLLGVFAPETAANLQQNIDATYAADPDSRAAFAGTIAAEGVKLATIAKAGAAAGAPGSIMAGTYGAQGFGGSRVRAEQLRRAGNEITGLQEFGTATGVGAVEALSGFVGARLFGAMGNQLKQIGPSVSKAFGIGGERAGQAAVRQAIGSTLTAGGLAVAEGAEEAVTQIVTNKITQVGMDPEQAVMEGVSEAALMGLILSPLGAGAISAPRAGGDVPGSSVAPEVADMIRDVEPTADQPDNRSLPAPPEPAGLLPAPARFVVDEAGGIVDRENAPEPVPSGQERFEAREARAAGLRQPTAAPEASPVPQSNVVARTEDGDLILTERAAAEGLVEQETQRRLNDPEVGALIEQGMDPAEAIETTFGSLPRVVEGTGVMADTFTAQFQPEADQQAGGDATFEGLPETAPESIKPQTRELVQQVQQVVGEDVGVRVVDELPGARGMYDRSTGTLYVKNDSPEGMAEALVHEAMHATGLDLDSEIGSPRTRRRLAKEYLSNFREYAKAYPDSEVVQQTLARLEENPAELEQEAVATLAGRLATDPTFAAQLANRDPGFVQRVVTAIRRAINSITGRQGDIDTLAQEMLARIEKNTGVTGEGQSFLPDAPMKRSRLESHQRDLAELVGKRSRATSPAAQSRLDDLIQQRRQIIETIKSRQDRPEGSLFLPEKQKKSRNYRPIPRMSSVKTLVEMAQDGAEGRDWYRSAKKEVAAAAKALNVTPQQFADVLALFSPRVSVRRNIRMAMHYIRAVQNGAVGDDRFTHDTMRTIRGTVGHWERTGEIRGPKTGPFAQALTGNEDAVVLDVWMARAFGIDQKQLERKAVRERSQDRVREAAAQLGWTPSETQAAVWTSAVKQVGRNPGQFSIGLEFPVTEQTNMVANRYMEDAGIEPGPPSPIEQMDESAARLVAEAYSQMTHDPDNPEVKASYDAFKRETLEQFRALERAGLSFKLDSIPNVAEKYPTAEKMIEEVDRTRVMFTADDPGDMPADHPMMEQVPGMDGWTYNHVFRAVHDFMGHIRTEAAFDILGEENAWRSHSQMYSDEARGAMTTETRAQSNWVGYGPKGPGNLQAVAENRIGDVEFPAQKAGLLPAEFHTPSGTREQQASFLPANMKKPGIRPNSGRFALPTGVEDFIAPISTRLSNISGKLYGRLLRFELRSRVQREDLQRAVGDFLREKNDKLTKDQQKEFTLHVSNGDMDLARDLLRKTDPSLIRGFDDSLRILDSIYAAARRAGIDVGYREDYWPREVKDYKRWRQEVVGDEPGPVRDAIALEETRRGRKLSPSEEIEVANRVLQGHGPRKPGATKPKAFRGRSQDRLTKDMLDLYADADHAIMGYINRAVHAIEKARLFGKGEVGEDILDSIGRYTAELVANGEITTDQEREVKDLLASRFTTGEASPSGMIRTIRDVGYLTVLANPVSALTQLGDLFLAGYRSGVIPALKSVAARKRIKMESLGIERIAAEFTDPGKLAAVLDWGMKMSGFQAIDRLGKETLLNAALRKFERAANNRKSQTYRDFEKQYRPIFGAQFDQLVQDLAADKITEDVRLLLFMELSGVQPISLSEMPKKYLDAPNGRIFYMLKTFTIKQLDMLRRNAFAKINRGEVREGATDLLRYALIFGLGNAGADLLKDWLLGRDVKWSDMAIDGLLRLFGGSKFLADSSIKDGPGRAFFSMLLPPTGVVDDAFKDTLAIPDIWSGDRGVRSLRNVPLVGKVLYWRAGEGARRAEDEEKTELRRREKEVRDQAIEALDSGDRTGATAIINKWNDEEKPGWMDNMTLRSVATSRRGRISSAFNRAKEDAAEALLNGDRERSQQIMDEFNETQPPRQLTMRVAEIEARRMQARGRTE